MALAVKNSSANANDIRDLGLIPGSERSPGGGHGNPLQCSCLENPMDRGAWRATVHWITKSQTRLKQPSMHTHDRPREHVKRQRHHFVDKDSYSQSYGFSSSHIWMWELIRKECWAPKNWCFGIVVLETTLKKPLTTRRSNQYILREINPEHSLEGLLLKLKLQYFGHLMWRADSLEKTLMLRKIEGKRKRGQQRMRWLGTITDSIDINLSKLWQIVEDREAWHAIVLEVTKSWTQLTDWAQQFVKTIEITFNCRWVCESGVLCRDPFRSYRFRWHYIMHHYHGWLSLLLCSVAQPCPTLWHSMDCSLPGSTVRGIFQARILESISILSSRGSSQPRGWTCVSYVSCIGRPSPRTSPKKDTCFLF